MADPSTCGLTECQSKPRCRHCTAMHNRFGPPATPAEAEELAKKVVGDYLTACRMASADPVAMGNYLMKLCSIAGCVMAQAEGSETAAARLNGTAVFVLKNMPREPAKIHKVQ